jgi:hypothetical protein
MGSAPFKFSLADLWSVLTHAICATVAMAAPVLLADVKQIGQAAASAAIAAAASTAIKLLQRFASDTRRPVP